MACSGFEPGAAESRAYPHLIFFANLGLFFFYFRSFQTNIIAIFTTNICENVHPVYGAGIRNHDLWNVSLFP